MSNSLDLDQAPHSNGLGLGPNCLQRSAADDKIHRWQAQINKDYLLDICWVQVLQHAPHT